MWKWSAHEAAFQIFQVFSLKFLKQGVTSQGRGQGRPERAQGAGHWSRPIPTVEGSGEAGHPQTPRQEPHCVKGPVSEVGCSGVLREPGRPPEVTLQLSTERRAQGSGRGSRGAGAASGSVI